MEETFVCSICGEIHPIHDCTTLDDQFLCPSCVETETTICVDCGERIWREDNAGNEDTPLCEPCYERSYVTCTRCGALLYKDDARYDSDDPDNEDPLCSSCYERLERTRVIQNYGYKPKPIFHGEDSRYFGVELEIDGGGEDNDNARDLIRLANRSGGLIYCKHDGSLNDGFEIVTHPMSLEFHERAMPWAEIMGEAISMGYTSHQAGTCGLHVHVNRNAFGSTEALQDACIARILYFFEKNWEELLKFSRRTQYQLDQWAARYGYKEHPKDILDHAKKGGGSGRYSCVNLQNCNTIEFRMFRGTLKYNTLIATLQLVNRVCEVALNLSDIELKELSWTTFVSGCQAPELVQYLKERRLYVNEPVEGEVEV